MNVSTMNLACHQTAPRGLAERPALPSPRRYDPPRLTEKRALAEVTLFSSQPCVPGDPGCTIGHP